jgi:hypothetical protein
VAIGFLRALPRAPATWQLNEFVPVIADVIKRRAATGLLEGEFNFNWVQEGGLVGLDDPVYGPTILSLADPTENITGYKKGFEEFFRQAERWPEAKDIQPAASASYLAAKGLNGELEVVVNTETITTRCVLCRLTSQMVSLTSWTDRSDPSRGSSASGASYGS